MLFEVISTLRYLPAKTGCAFLACQLVACSGDAPGAEQGDAGDVADAAIDLSLDTDIPFEGGVDDVTEASEDTGQLHPCVEAPMLPSSGSVTGTINPMGGDAHHYRFEAEAGEFIMLSGQSQMAFTTPGNDPVFSLLTADGTRLIASCDDLGFGFDGAPLLVTRLAQQGVYCARVEHVSTWAGVPSLPASAMEYSLVLERLSESDGRTEVDKEPNDTIGEAQTLEKSAGVAFTAIGMLDGAQDVDVYKFPSVQGRMLEVIVPSGGPGGPGVNGNGSTLGPRKVELSDAVGHVLARSEPGPDRRWILAGIDAGQDVFVTVERTPGAPPGDNDFYFAVGAAISSIPIVEEEVQAGENDSLATAETMYTVLEYESATDYHKPFGHPLVIGEIHETPEGAPEDVDFHAFAVEGLEALEVFCQSNSVGSGVVNPRFAIVDSTGQVLREGLETAQQPVIWGYDHKAKEPALILPEAGQYYLRVTGDGQLSDVASRYYYCELYTWPG